MAGRAMTGVKLRITGTPEGTVGVSIMLMMMMHQLLPSVDGHAFQTKPVSRQYSRTREFNDG